jgi:subtilisin family serine protease
LKNKRIQPLFVLFLIFTCTILSGQSGQFNYFYRVYFRDKGEYNTESFSASQLLSERSLERRARSAIPVPDTRDLPVFPGYLAGVSSLGLTLHCTSKWMNTGLFKTNLPVDPGILLSMPYVADVKIVKNPAGKSGHTDKLAFPAEQADAPPYDRPISMVNGLPLHPSGFNGHGILIAVLDGGFLNADIVSSLQHLRNRHGIKGTYDFVDNDAFVYSYHNHGTAVLSVLAGQIDGMIEGTAPGADFLLLRTEDTGSEFPVEEDLWAAGAEFADSAGADIISSSLGYSTFDDPSLNYKFSDLDGNTAFVTRAADIAASKGMLVICSAGNERNKTWQRILAPSDGDSVISVGAVDGYSLISAFSSAGPSADRRIKPDITTMGVSVTVQTDVSLITRSSGTSFSCPVLSGMAACLMQAVPAAVNIEIIDALHYSADRYSLPDSLYGYGIPNMLTALEQLQDRHVIKPDIGSVAGPNPTTGDVEITFREAPGSILIEIFNASGTVFFRKEFEEYAGRTLRIQSLNNMRQGMYFIRVITGTGTFTHKIIKLSN